MFKRLIKPKLSRSTVTWLLGAIVVLSCAAPAAADVDVTAISDGDAEQILDAAEATVVPEEAPAGAEPAVDATLALHDLALAYPELEGEDRDRARALLARPTDGNDDQFGDGYPPAAPVASAESTHFCVFWVNAPKDTFPDAPSLTDANGVADGDGVPDYVESVLQIAEYSRSIEVAPGPMGWRAPKPDVKGCGQDPSTRADIYLKQLGDQGLFGYETVDPGQGQARSQYGYLVLDNDYAKSEYGYDDPTIPLSVTAAHEYNHLLQMTYDAFQDLWMLEATATWSEEHVYPDVNDWLNYVNVFAKYPGEPITTIYPPDDKRSLRIYGTATWNHWLDVGRGGYGAGLIRRAWELSTKTDPADFALAAFDEAIERSGGRGLSHEFTRFAIATAEWRAGAAGNLPDHASYPDVSRDGSLARGGDRKFNLDHTAYRLIEIRPPANGALTLRADLDDGVRGGLGLVARDGDPLSGDVVQERKFLSEGGKGTVTLDQASRFERITAVLVNADDRIKGFNRSGWVYKKENAGFKVRLTD